MHAGLAVLSPAKFLHKSLGETLSSLLRRSPARLVRGSETERNGIPLLQRRSARVTPELVRQLRDELTR